MTVPTQGASALVHRSLGEMDEVHAYALSELANAQALLDRVRLKIETKKNSAAMAVKAYIESVDEAVQSLRAVEDAVLVIEEKVGEV